jgi:hypothetical protein
VPAFPASIARTVWMETRTPAASSLLHTDRDLTFECLSVYSVLRYSTKSALC